MEWGRKDSDTTFTFNFQIALKLKISQSVSHSVMSNSLACQAPLSMGFSRQEYWSATAFSQGWLLEV